MTGGRIIRRHCSGSAISRAARLLAMGAALSLSGCGDKAPAKPEPHGVVEHAVIALPNGATIVAPPGSVGARIAGFLASGAPGPQAFETGGAYFTAWSGDPTPTGQARLSAFTQLLKAYPKATVMIIGHTDNDGDAAANDKLSIDRANRVVDLLVANGIAARRLSAVGHGLREPIADNATEAGRARNRRITIVLTHPAS